jgi:hypothetical protein
MKPTLPLSFLLCALLMPQPVRADDEAPRPPLAAGEIEVRLGNGAFGRITPPRGWTKGTGSGDEQCFNASDNIGRLCITKSWKRGRDAKQILEESLSGLSCIKQEDKSIEDGPVRAIRRECIVAVGPRREGRIWIVSAHEQARDAVSLSVHLGRDDKPFLDTVLAAIDSFRYYVPAAPAK